MSEPQMGGAGEVVVPSTVHRESGSASHAEPPSPAAEVVALPPGVLTARVGAGANCSSAGSAIDILFYTSVIAGAVAVALSAAFPPRSPAPVAARIDSANEPPPGDDSNDDAQR